MDFSHYSDQPVEIAVDLINTVDVVSGEEKLATGQDLADFIEGHNGEWFRTGWKPTNADLDEVKEIRSRLRRVFEAEDEAEAADRLNLILADVDAVPRISVHGTQPHLHFESEDESPARYLGAITAMGLIVAMIEGGFERFGICRSTTCDDVFVDISRNRSRRHCSETCTTRENVAAHRARQRAN